MTKNKLELEVNIQYGYIDRFYNFPTKVKSTGKLCIEKTVVTILDNSMSHHSIYRGETYQVLMNISAFSGDIIYCSLNGIEHVYMLKINSKNKISVRDNDFSYTINDNDDFTIIGVVSILID